MSSEIFVGAYCRDMRTALTISIDNRSTQLFLSIGHSHTSPLDNQDLFSLSERTEQEKFALPLQAYQHYNQQFSFVAYCWLRVSI